MLPGSVVMVMSWMWAVVPSMTGLAFVKFRVDAGVHVGAEEKTLEWRHCPKPSMPEGNLVRLAFGIPCSSQPSVHPASRLM